MLQNLRNRKGFTLVELMIVVAIIGILAAIAIPNFLQFRLKAKTSEAKSNLGAIRSTEVAYYAEWDFYVGNQGMTPTGGRSGNTSKVPWVISTRFSILGFAPEGAVYYDYALLSTVLGRRADLSWRSVVLEASGKYLLYPSTPVFALQADSFRRVGEFLKLVSSNSVGLTILVSTRPLSLDQLNSMAINIVTTSYSDVTWSVSLCVTPSPCAQSILMAAECLRNRRAVVAPSEIGVLVGRPYREAVLRFELNNLENLFSALIAAVNRVSTVKKIFIRGLEETR